MHGSDPLARAGEVLALVPQIPSTAPGQDQGLGSLINPLELAISIPTHGIEYLRSGRGRPQRRPPARPGKESHRAADEASRSLDQSCQPPAAVLSMTQYFEPPRFQESLKSLKLVNNVDIAKLRA